MKRLFDFGLSAFLLAIFSIPMLVIALAVKLTSPGPAIYVTERVGRNNKIFRMPKFRSMQVGTPALATHLLTDADCHITRIGSLLRRSSLDELPQLFSILTGQMSFVGPRPALYNQYDLIQARTACGIDALVPGLTGWAQVNGRDTLSLEAKVAYDTEYLNKKSLWFDLQIMAITFLKVLRGTGITQAPQTSASPLASQPSQGELPETQGRSKAA